MSYRCSPARANFFAIFLGFFRCHHFSMLLVEFNIGKKSPRNATTVVSVIVSTRVLI